MGSMFSMPGDMYQGQANSAAAKSSANLHGYEAAANEQNAQLALDNAGENEIETRRAGAQQAGMQAAAIGESGIGMTSNTAYDLTRESAINTELAALKARYSGAASARAFRNQASIDRYSVGVDNQNATIAKYSGYMKAGGDFIQGIPSAIGAFA